LVEVWNEVTSVDDDLVGSTLHYLFNDGEELLSTASMGSTLSTAYSTP
jgi:hypothetical protein